MSSLLPDMKRGLCPRCDGDDVRVVRGYSQRVFLPLTWLGSAVRIESYVCPACGYVEEYVRPSDLPKIAAKGTPVADLERV